MTLCSEEHIPMCLCCCNINYCNIEYMRVNICITKITTNIFLSHSSDLY